MFQPQKKWESTTLQVPRKLLSSAGALVVVAAILGAGFFAWDFEAGDRDAKIDPGFENANVYFPHFKHKNN